MPSTPESRQKHRDKMRRWRKAHPRTPASRQENRDRMRRYRKANPQRARENNRKNWRRWSLTHIRRKPRVDAREAAEFYQAGLSIISRWSPLKYLDVHGRLREEKELSAEELIRRWNEKQEGSK